MFVPCHRVVGSDGSLTGYAGGLEKKRRMLIDEKIPFAGEKAALSDLFTFAAVPADLQPA